MSRKLFQNLVFQVREIIDNEFGIMDENGIILACSDELKIGQECPCAEKVMACREPVVELDGSLYRKVYIKNKLEFVTFISDADEGSGKYLSLFSINAANIRAYHDEKFDKLGLLKSIMTDSVLPPDVPLKARELHIAYNARRVVFLIRTGKTKDVYAHEIIQGLFPNKLKDFVLVMDDENTVLVKEVRSNEDLREIEKSAQAIIDTLAAESMVNAFVGVGTIAENITDLRQSFEEARMALSIGSIFEANKRVVSYDKLGLGRLIYQIPEEACRLFLKEIFKNDSLQNLDDEYMSTVQKFFENSLNISETSRQMYVHRNTLVYRLEKIQKMTGLDLTRFDDSIVFKFAILVKRYLDRNTKMI